MKRYKLIPTGYKCRNCEKIFTIEYYMTNVPLDDFKSDSFMMRYGKEIEVHRCSKNEVGYGDILGWRIVEDDE